MAKRILILVSGLAATGKSTLRRQLSKALGVRGYSGGDALMRIAAEMGFKPGGRKWWDTEEGMRFLAMRRQDPSFDRRVDEMLKEIAREGSAIIDSWVLPWLVEDGFKVWLKATTQARAKRLSKRGGMSIEEAQRILEERDRENKQLYYELYGIRLGEDLSPFNIVLDTTHMPPRGVYKVVRESIRWSLKV